MGTNADSYKRDDIFEMHDTWHHFYIYHNPERERVTITVDRTEFFVDPKNIIDAEEHGNINAFHNMCLNKHLEHIAQESQEAAHQEQTKYPDVKGMLNIYSEEHLRGWIILNRILSTPRFLLEERKTLYGHFQKRLNEQKSIFEGYKKLNNTLSIGIDYLKKMGYPELEASIKIAEDALYQSKLILYSKRNLINSIVENASIWYPEHKNKISKYFVTL